jgi:hypothetical protein
MEISIEKIKIVLKSDEVIDENYDFAANPIRRLDDSLLLRIGLLHKSGKQIPLLWGRNIELEWDVLK